MRTSLTLFAVVAVSISMHATAQESDSANTPTAEVGSLAEIAALALRHDPRTEAAASGLDRSRATRELALSGFRPDIAFTSSAGRARYDANGFPHPDRDPNGATLSLVQPVYDFGRTQRAVSSANAAVSSAQALTNAIAIDVIRDAVTTALNVDLAHRRLDTVVQNARVLGERLAYTRGKFEAGDFTRTDVAQAEARYSGALALTESARADLVRAQASLEQLIGSSVDVNLASLPSVTVPSSLANALASAGKHPELEAAEQNLRGAEEGVKAAHAELRPRVDFVGQLGRDDDSRLSLATTDYWTAALQFSVPIYDRGIARAHIDHAKAVSRGEQAQLAIVQRSLEQRVRSQWGDLSAAKAELSAARDQERAAEVALEGMQAELDTGLRTVVDLLNAQQESLDAKLNVLNARYQETASAVRLLAATGELQLTTLGGRQ
jgi:TolC family type I secretion outer membrane protein